MRLGRSPEKRLICTGLVLGAFAETEITARGLRALPLTQFLTMATYWELGSLAPKFDGPLPRPGPKGYSVDHFEKVAREYRRSLETAPRAPTRDLARRLHCSEPTARRWVQRCRDMGILGRAVPGKAGEVSDHAGGEV